MLLKKKKKVISFLVSGKGSNFKAVAEKIIGGYINAETGILISSSSDALAIKKAEELGIKSIAIEPKDYSTKAEHEAEIIKYLKLYKTDLIVAAGYMRILTPSFINIFRYKIINIHPSLLPSFTGKNAQQQALDYGVKISGCTTHFVDEGTDTGPIIMQAAVDIDSKDDITALSTKILREEHKILVESVKLYCEEKLTVKNNIVLIDK
jgi:phosphoribosylglycinamide formyltransferase-1